jgi:hypothetical protein
MPALPCLSMAGAGADDTLKKSSLPNPGEPLTNQRLAAVTLVGTTRGASDYVRNQNRSGETSLTAVQIRKGVCCGAFRAGTSG